MIREANVRVGDVVLWQSVRWRCEVPALVVELDGHEAVLSLPVGHPEGPEPMRVDQGSLGFLLARQAVGVIRRAPWGNWTGVDTRS